MDPSDILLRFLEGVGRRSEAAYYLGLFRTAEKERFAMLLLESTALRHTADAVTLDLRFLTGLGLIPVVVLGIYSPGSALHQAGHLRDLLTRAEVPTGVVSMSGALADIPSTSVASPTSVGGIHGHVHVPVHVPGHVPVHVPVHGQAIYRPAEGTDPADEIAHLARANRVPLVIFDGDTLPTLRHRFSALGDLVAKLQSRRLVVLGRRGGLGPAGTDRPISVVDLATDYDELIKGERLPQMQRFLLKQIRHILMEQANHKMTVSVTSPLSLLRELFTVRGAGTLIRRGFSIQRKMTFAEVDRERLEGLLVSSFGRPLAQDFFERKVSRIYLEEGYRGVALVVDSPLGGYLTKFAVDREAQGEGMGRDLWEVVTADYPALFWRARPDNPIVSWYLQECDGMTKVGEWHVFWKGLPPEQIPAAVAYCLSSPIDFKGITGQS